MTISEVFPNPTVKQVIFQILFPNLLFLENRIGDFQQAIMATFPDSELVYRQQIVFVDLGPETKIEQVPRNEATRKIWKFTAPDQVTLNVLTDSLDISSESHKTYNNPTSDRRFRDTIQFVVDAFLQIAKIPLIRRIGLRYIDECPIPEKTNESFRSYYNSTFPLERFSLKEAEIMEFKTLVRRNGYLLRYSESLQMKEGRPILVLDFDGFVENVKATEYLAITDRLHDLILEEYEKTIKAPVYEYMRQQPLGKGGTADERLQAANA